MISTQPISVFDVIGPIMVGPSSSHTAGAVRLGSIGRSLLGCTPKKALIELHGSFAETGRGHGTDKAIIAGLLGLIPQDTRLRQSLALAKSYNMQIEFRNVNLGDEAHPNSCRITISTEQENIQYIGCSVGGGLIQISELVGYPVDFTGELDCVIVIAKDQPGTISQITAWMFEHHINVAYFTVNRQERGGLAIMTIQTDQPIPDSFIKELDQFPWIQWARAIKKLED
jgi:L-serine dehydratase